MPSDVLQLSPRITCLPVIHGSGDFSLAVRRLMLEQAFDCVAVPLPPSFQQDVERAIEFLPSPSLVTILRQTPGGGQIPIRVSLNRALRDPRERVIIQPGDVVILQETLDETLARYFTSVFHTTFVGTLIRQRDLTGAASLSVP